MHVDLAPLPGQADVAIVGYGPVGQLLGLLLGRAGHRVVIVERQTRAYPLPRAVHFDDEIGRILQGVGLSPDALSDVVRPYDDFYEWRSAGGDALVRLDWRGPGPSGWHISHFFHQPGLEQRLDVAVRAVPAVSVHRGWEAVKHSEFSDAVELGLRSAHGESTTVRAKWVVGADGANSAVRSWIGSSMTDLGYFHDWLVVDLVDCTPAADRHFRPPAWQLCDPARPTTLVPAGPGRRRFEFMRLDHETRAELSAESSAWRLLEPWGIAPDNSRIERSAVYTFQARWCDEWRAGRLLIAGDAAHLMPPFAGQGMCSGLRDAVNLAWKLDAVLGGRAASTLLDTYGPERAEHVRHFIAASMHLGEVICITDRAAAAQRDRDMRAALQQGIEPAPRPLPRLGPGLHRDDAGGATLSIQALVSDGDRTALFDDLVGVGGVLLSTVAVDKEVRNQLEANGFKVAVISDDAGAGVIADSTGAYREWFAQLNAAAVLIRPDHYVYGTASTASAIPGLVRDFTSALHGTAVATASAR
ncbi:3-(3-hydroxyphenyl)propionate hydroxylase [Mycolicibacterium farcinogenes]|uniref:3-(3-hydroxyphenyl)propionate hydroxylase n=1 Tax=Mycolicibacterium senegalense TaxID=1796 RepID=A0A378W7H6_9MYCO|nr:MULTISPECIES: bifunctional 3-(3-hydroxy-phenyl)propionate/3-hydroxycinnamic acid hydroxylase [Mycolicibacterium]CDP86693.1 3-(3-hydroxyphenyl)propionate hydroxylase [Mycolicibacterium farcinogenes]SUA28524.1 3-(3-hydroxyphenyl)propionate hydroxylase [Mycolicibacterium senegalense]